MRLTNHEEQTIINALRVAADKYKENAKNLRSNAPLQNRQMPYIELSEQFERQEKEARELADRIENEGI